MSGWTEGACPCGAFILVPEGEERQLCTDCAALAREVERRESVAAAKLAADPLRCRECRTLLLEPAELCGICAPPSVFARACEALAQDLAAAA